MIVQIVPLQVRSTMEVLYHHRMMTLKQACMALQISYPTLEKWLARLGIEPLRQHYAFDHRLGAITDEHVAVIRTARDELADTAPHHAIAPVRPLNAPQRHAGRVGMPGGWISYNRWLDIHHINRFASEEAIKRGRMVGPTRGEWWERPQGPTLSAFSPEQHAAASQYAARRWGERFIACPQCSSLVAVVVEDILAEGSHDDGSVLGE
jgi:hypothetical protein